MGGFREKRKKKKSEYPGRATIINIGMYFVKNLCKTTIIGFFFPREQKWYFVSKIVLTYCEKKMFR